MQLSRARRVTHGPLFFPPRSNLKAEKVNARDAVQPFLQAELDRANIRSEKAAADREAAIMSEVKSWKAGVSVYNTEKYVPPQPSVAFGKY